MLVDRCAGRKKDETQADDQRDTRRGKQSDSAMVRVDMILVETTTRPRKEDKPKQCAQRLAQQQHKATFMSHQEWEGIRTLLVLPWA